VLGFSLRIAAIFQGHRDPGLVDMELFIFNAALSTILSGIALVLGVCWRKWCLANSWRAILLPAAALATCIAIYLGGVGSFLRLVAGMLAEVLWGCG
jgi:hypothetical protein